jgi:hypothetical protein
MLCYHCGKRAAKPVDCSRGTLLCQQVVAFVFVSLLVAGCAHTILVGRDHSYPKADWKTDLQYDNDEIKPLYMSWTGCPEVEVQLNGKPFHLKYDFGCSKGFQITTAIEDKADYAVLEETNTYEADGTFRGKVKRIKVDSLEVFGNRFENQEGTLADWRIFSSLPYEGLIGLEYFTSCRFTLDYRRRKLGLTRKLLPDTVRESHEYEFIELLDPPDYHKYGVYALGEVNGAKCVIHIDTGCSRTTVDPAILTADQKAKHDGNRCSAESLVSLGGFTFTIRDFRVAQIRHPSPSRYPVRMGIGSDLLKHLMITIDRTENRNVLIIHK